MGEENRDGTMPEATPMNANDSESPNVKLSERANKPDGIQRLTNRQSNTTNGQFPEPSFIDGLKTVKVSDLSEVHKRPCVRESLMTGIGAGFAIGGFRAILGARILIACNWAVGSFIAGSVLMHEYCQWGRRTEKKNMKRIVETVQRKKAENKLRAQDAKEGSGARK